MTRTGGMGRPRESGTACAMALACSLVEIIETKYTSEGVKSSWTVRLIRA